MSSTPTDRAEFVSIGQDVFLRRADAKAPNAETDPEVILVFGWMGAKLAHIHKYTKKYEELYPAATQILIRSEPSFFFSFPGTRRAKLRPVVEALQALGYVSTPQSKLISQPRILVHSFSNGGGLQMLSLGQLLHSQGITPEIYRDARTISALIVDSSPGGEGFRNAIRVFAQFFPSLLIRIPLTAILTILYPFRIIRTRIFGTVPLFTRLKNGLAAPSILPWFDQSTPRLYIYSRQDEMVPFDEVREHVAHVREAGLNVREEAFENSPHVAHARTDPPRYWNAVQELWSSAVAVMTGVLKN
ncbi:hypothetical protein K435DRAFT_860068 [Dendrothele bispora CBS 962.96]|uniref:DUF829-domain-containing protein n=1 Tax=Dendrothele bispora (strain CBS 962.96) TaxID=1314807 RepID=A0A4S8M012_DENBC|nr:hypothetical protein K435DRAFT_860068 [Dendrothele bispora CBS 962.96]